jgi:hypothetical protein
MLFLSSGATLGPSFGPNSWNGTSSYLNDKFRQGTAEPVPPAPSISGTLVGSRAENLNDKFRQGTTSVVPKSASN